MARDSRGRYTARVVGRGRRLRVTGIPYGDEVDGVRSGPVVYLSGGPEPAPERSDEDTAPPTRSRRS